MFRYPSGCGNGVHEPATASGQGSLATDEQSRFSSRLSRPDPNTVYEFQLKGASRMPFSRSADGLAVLRSSILTSCSGSRTCVGCPYEALRVLGEWTVKRVPKLDNVNLDASNAMTGVRIHARCQSSIRTSNLQLIASCGYLIPDGVSIAGLTIDYGPYAFMDVFDPHYICNHSDQECWYAYNQQPNMMLVSATEEWLAWLDTYAARIESEKTGGEWGEDFDEMRERAAMAANPRLVLRQWLLEGVIKKVEHDPETGKYVLGKVMQMACSPCKPWGREGDMLEELGEEEREERRYCGLGDGSMLWFQCSRAS
ncbi:hypothetical protein BKA83DRAFT_4497767 [Pisolithus microcarpus]|nr:hypothetical protein BKA83DRAFT_4497767 [Pisolithus microcarpus]